MRLNSCEPCTVAAHVQADCRIRPCSGVGMDVRKRAWISPHRTFEHIEVRDAQDQMKVVLQLLGEEGGAHQMYLRSATQSAVC